jgi:hypothetical protein
MSKKIIHVSCCPVDDVVMQADIEVIPSDIGYSTELPLRVPNYVRFCPLSCYSSGVEYLPLFDDEYRLVGFRKHVGDKAL